MQHFLQISYMMVGNFSFLYFLTIVLNLTNFDDDFFISMIPNKFLKFFELDVILLVEDDDELEVDKKEENENKKEKNKNEKNSKITEEELTKEVPKNKNPYDVEDDEEEEIIVVKSKEKKDETKSQVSTHIITEILTFLNFFCITVIWTFHFIFPFKLLVTDYFKISKNEFLSIVLNNSYLNVFMLLVFFFIIFKFIWNHFEAMYNDINDLIDSKNNILLSMIGFLLNFILKILFIIFVSMYFLASVESLYKSVNLKISSKLFKGGLNLSHKYFDRFHIINNYGLFKNKMTTERQELEIKYLTKNSSWKNVNFNYKPSVSNSDLHFIMPHQPRLDWLITSSAYSRNIESEPYLIILLGKVLEKNPVILDLLGYKISGKDIFYKCNYFFFIKCR